MRKHLITFILLLVASFTYGQEHEFYFQIMPHVGNFKNTEVDGVDSVVITKRYTPLTTVCIGIQSKSRLFYQVQCGVQIANVEHVFSRIMIDNEGGFINDHPRPLDFGVRVAPNLFLGVGYDFTDRNRMLLQTSLWSCTLGYEHAWESFNAGINGGKMFDFMANKLHLGPGTRDRVSKGFSWLEKDSGFIFSAYVNLKLSSIFGTNKISKDGSGDSNKGTPKEF
jgi:hypothetical protein